MGFGFTLLAVSFFLLIIASGDAVQLLIIINFAISLALIVRVRKDVDWVLWARLLAGAVVGIPIGLLAFENADVDQLKIFAAIAILTFVAMTVFQGSGAARRGKSSAGESSEFPSEFRSPSAVGVGLVAGVMTTALGMPGPPVVLYLTSVGIGKDRTRSITLTFFAVSYGAALLLQTATVGVSAGVWTTAAILVPVAAIGALLGDVLSRRISESVFRKVVLTLVAATGGYVLFDTLFR